MKQFSCDYSSRLIRTRPSFPASEHRALRARETVTDLWFKFRVYLVALVWLLASVGVANGDTQHVNGAVDVNAGNYIAMSHTPVAQLTTVRLSLLRKLDDYLRQEKFPWYDPDRDEITSVPIEVGPQAASRQRNQVPIAKPVPQVQPTTQAPAASLWWFDAAMYAVLGLLIATVVGLLIWFFMTKSQRDEEELDAEIGGSIDVSRIAELPFAIGGNPADFRAQAARAAQEGNFTKATIYLFSHLLLILDKHQWLRLRKGRTNRQYLWELSRRSNLRAYFEASMIPFEQAFFGAKSIESHVFTNLWSQLPGIEAIIGQKENEAQHVT